jgi:hypothetical protein
MNSVHTGRPGIVFTKSDGRVDYILSPSQLRLLRTIRPGMVLPIRDATRVIWPEQTGSLTPSQRASAARSVTRLVEHNLIERRDAGVAITTIGRLAVLQASMATPVG